MSVRVPVVAVIGQVTIVLEDGSVLMLQAGVQDGVAIRKETAGPDGFPQYDIALPGG